MIAALFAALVALHTPTPTPSPSPSPSPSALPVIGEVRVATGSQEAVHRLPVPASLLDQQAIQMSPAITGDAVLRGLPGFDFVRSNSMFTNYGQLRASFGGLGEDRGLVLADGIFAQDGFGGQIDWAQYPGADLTRAELLRGPGSALYGGGAIGGVLSLQSFAPTTATAGPAQGELSILGGTHEFEQGYARVTAPLSPKFSMSASVQQQQLQFYDLTPAYSTGHESEAQAQTSMTSVRFRYAPDPDTEIDYAYRGAWDYQQQGRPNYDFWRNLVQNALHVAHSTKRGTVSLSLYQRDAFVNNQADKFPSAPGVLEYTQNVPTHETGALADWIAQSANSTFEVHADAKFVGGTSIQWGGTGAFESSGSGVQDLAGLALQETLRGKRFEIVGGLRGDSIDILDTNTVKGTVVTPIAPRTMRALSPRLAARYDLSKELAFRASGGGAFRAPYLNELLRGYQIGTIQYLPNANLDPERSSSLTGGFDWLHGRTEVTLDYLHAYVNDAIDFRTISTSPTVIQERSNFSHTRTDGTTLVVVHRMTACSRMTFTADQQYARITAGTPGEIGKQLPYVPKGYVSGGYDTMIGAVQAGASVNYMGMTWADDLNTEALGDAVTAGLHASFPIQGGARVILNADNVTNARYMSSIDRFGPPQVISLGVAAPIGSAAPSPCTR